MTPEQAKESWKKWYREAFGALREVVGPFDISEIPNQYHAGICCAYKPWYVFKVSGRSFKVGPRKSVDAVHVSSPMPFDITTLSKEAQEAGVSFWADGDWQPKASLADCIEVHSYTFEQLKRWLILAATGEVRCHEQTREDDPKQGVPEA